MKYPPDLTEKTDSSVQITKKKKKKETQYNWYKFNM